MRKLSKGYLFSLFSLAALLIGLSGTGVVFAKAYTRLASHQKAAPLTGKTWSIVPSPNVGSGSNVLNGVAAVSASLAWAVGENGNGQTLIEQWNGTSWSIVPSPNVGSGSNDLYGVAAVSANDIWAVGVAGNGQTLIEHWNGRQWGVAPSPSIAKSINILYGVSVVSANNIWAVGDYNTRGVFADETLTEHWNGRNWSIVPSPNVSTTVNDLYGVAAVSANDIWAVGVYSTNVGVSPTLIEHWDGTSWSVVSNVDGILLSVAALSASNVWTVGENSSGQTLIEQWNGTSWNVVSSPNVSNINVLTGVVTVSASDVWAVGYYYNSTGPAQTLIEQWNGTSWSVVPSPGLVGILKGVARIPGGTNMWAVGQYSINGGSSYQTLIEFYG